MAHSLNDAFRFRLALAGSPDVVDDPQGFDSPLAQWAARLGISPGEFCEICRQFQKLRTERVNHGGEDGGVGGSLDFQGVNAPPQSVNFIHSKAPQIGNVNLSNARTGGGSPSTPKESA